MPKQACPEEMLKQVQHDTFRVRHDRTDNFAICATGSKQEVIL